MAKLAYLLLINEDEADIARRELADELGVKPTSLLQVKYEHPGSPGKVFYVCNTMGPASGFSRITDRAAELIEGTYLILDVTELNPQTELSSRGYTPAGQHPFDRFPFDQIL